MLHSSIGLERLYGRLPAMRMLFSPSLIVFMSKLNISLLISLKPFIFLNLFSNNGIKFRSISTEVQEVDLFMISSVKFPVPGPISTKMSFFSISIKSTNSFSKT